MHSHRPLTALLAVLTSCTFVTLPASAAVFVENAGHTYCTEDGSTYVSGWVEQDGTSYLFDTNGCLLVSGATADGHIVDESGACVGTIGVDTSCITSVATSGSDLVFTIDPTPDVAEDAVYNTVVTLPAATEKTSTDYVREQVVNLALSMVGVPYVWGGESAYGVDCSGFTRYVYGQAAGIELLHYTDYQAVEGTAVSYYDLQPGDLCCYDWDSSGNIDHVGIYLGNGEIAEAGSASGRVVITSVCLDGHYPVTCRNLIG